MKKPTTLFGRWFAGTLLLAALFATPHQGVAQEPDSTALPPKILKVERGAKLVLACPDHDFGEVDRRGGDLKYRLVIRNEGVSPLVITRVITSCTCLKSDFSKRPIPPGGEEVLRLTYEPLKAAPGTFNKVVQILSNSITGRELFTIRGNSVEKKQKNNDE